MAMLANIVVAELDEAEAIGESSRPVEEWKGLEMVGLDQEKLALLHALLSGQLSDEAARDFRLYYAASDEGPWLLRFPADSVQRLARLEDAALEQVGEELAATESFEAAGWPADLVQKLVADLADLAGVAAAQEKPLFVWLMAIERD